MEAILFLVQLSVLICVFAREVTFNPVPQGTPDCPINTTTRLILFWLPSLSQMAHIRQTKKEAQFDQKKNGKSIQQQLGETEGGRHRKRQPACISGLLSCWHITARTVTFGLVPPP